MHISKCMKSKWRQCSLHAEIRLIAHRNKANNHEAMEMRGIISSRIAHVSEINTLARRGNLNES